MGTPMLLKPTLDEVLKAARDIGLPEHEARKFFHYYESQGWRVGKVKMVSFMNALQGWRIRWMERTGSPELGVKPASTAMDKMIALKELDRVEERMRIIKGGYSENMDWTQKDRDEMKRLKARRSELKQKLGMMV